MEIVELGTLLTAFWLDVMRHVPEAQMWDLVNNFWTTYKTKQTYVFYENL